jgi:hypothetical protein
MQQYLRWRNANARHPDVLAAQRRERAKVRSDRQQRWGRPNQSRLTPDPANVHGQRTRLDDPSSRISYRGGRVHTGNPTEYQLGPLISTHPVAGRRRWRSGLVGAVIALPGVFIVALSVLDPPSTDVATPRASGRVLGLGLILLAVGLPIAMVQLTRAVRGGRHEVFKVHEQGLVHQAWRTRYWTWDQVTAVRVRWDMDGTLWKRLGWNFRCWIRFADNARVRVDGLARDGRRIAETVVARRPTAVVQGPARAWRLLPLLILFFAGTLAWTLWYGFTNGGDHTVERNGTTSIEPILSDTVGSLLAVGVTISIIGLVFSVIAFLGRPRS